MTSLTHLISSWSVVIAITLIVVAMVLAFIRLVIGPSLPDRIVALDLITYLAVAFMGVFAVLSGHSAFLDVAIALALLGFLATVAFARYVERSRARTSISEDRDD
ncbi:MAG: pH regulation protein F [Rhodospirillales bacterium]|nr:MAG: pH regulation protein F [Rhodospirillales bacterium]